MKFLVEMVKLPEIENMEELTVEKEEFKQNIGNCAQWSRLIYMLLFGVVLYLVMSVLTVVVVVQVILALVTGNTNDNIRQFSTDLARYINQIVLFLTYNEDTRPFPFTPWQSVTEPSSQDDSKP